MPHVTDGTAPHASPSGIGTKDRPQDLPTPPVRTLPRQQTCRGGSSGVANMNAKTSSVTVASTALLEGLRYATARLIGRSDLGTLYRRIRWRAPVSSDHAGRTGRPSDHVLPDHRFPAPVVRNDVTAPQTPHLPFGPRSKTLFVTLTLVGLRPNGFVGL